MVWSHRKNFIFIHVPKTGGTTIEKGMNLMGSRNGYGIIKNTVFQHFTSNEVKQLLGDRIFNFYDKISIVRNPYDRFISEYYWCKIDGVGYKSNQSFNEFIDYVEKCVKEKNFYETIYHDHFIPQWMYICINDEITNQEKIAVDHLLRFENFDNVKNFFMKNYAVSLKHENYNSLNKDFELNNNQKKRIYNIYKKDFELLGYDSEL